jgi:hypothetical protein
MTDIARIVFGAYPNEKPVRIEGDDIYGMVNPCRFGFQCEKHSCYCDHEDGPRKCHYSWFTGGEEPDSQCELFEPNPYWQEGGDFYDSRDATIAEMDRLGLVERVARD